MALVSVIIPTFDRATCLRRAVQSVLTQTVSDIEVIVVDDCSTDGTITGLRPMRDKRLRVIHMPERSGAQLARLAGMRAATGEWFAFLDSDDLFFVDALEVRVVAARESGADVVYSEGEVTDPTNPERRLCGVDAGSGDVFKRVLATPGPMFQGMLLRRDAVIGVPFLDVRIVAFQEWDASIELARHLAFHLVSKPTFVWDRTEADTISKDAWRNARGYEQVVNKHIGEIARDLGGKALAQHYLTLTRLYALAGHRREAWRCLLRCLQFGGIGIKRLLDGKSALRVKRKAKAERN